MSDTDQSTFATPPRQHDTTTRFRVTALLRGDEPGHRSASSTRRVVRLARYLGVDCGVQLVLHAAGGSGRVDAWLDLFGQGASNVTPADVAAMCELSLLLAAPEPAVRPVLSLPVAEAFELTRVRTGPVFGLAAEELAFQPEWITAAKHADRVAAAQPRPSMDHAEELVRALARVTHDTWVVTTLMSPNALDLSLVLDELDAALGRAVRIEPASAIVCARTLVASTGPVSPAVLAGIVHRSPQLEAVPLDPSEADRVLGDPAAALRGHAVTEEHAAALTRIPTASGGARLGIATRLPAPACRPLDPPLADPVAPVRLGAAVDVTGASLDAVLDAQDLRRHLFVEGKTGSGKSALLKSLAISWLDTGNPLVVLDPHGDVAAAVAARAHGRRGRVMRYVDHGDLQHPVGLNLLAEPDPELWEQNVDGMLESMARIIDPGTQGMFGDRAKRTFWLVARAARHVYAERLSVVVVQALLLSQGHLRALAAAIEPVAPDLAHRVRAELVDLPDREWNELVSWYQSRFHMWQRTRALRETTGTGVDAVDMVDVLDGDVDLVVDLSSTELGGSVAGFLGGLYLTKLRSAMARRANRDIPVLVVFDEAHLFADEAPDRLLAEGRKYGLALAIATQSADNLTPRLARAIEANVGSFVSLRTGINLAGSASRRLGGWPAGELTRLPDLTAAASLSSRGIPTDPFTLNVDYYERAALSGWSHERTAQSADLVAHATVEALWRPHADVQVPSDAEIVAALRAGVTRTPRPGNPETRGISDRTRPPGGSSVARGGHDQWLVAETLTRLRRYELAPREGLLDELYVLVGALKVAGYIDAYEAMRTRLRTVVGNHDGAELDNAT